MTGKICEAFLDLTGGVFNTRVRLSNLRQKLGDIDRATLDKALLALAGEEGSVLMQFDNRMEITDADESMQKRGDHEFLRLSSRYYPGSRAMQKLVWRLKLESDFGNGSATEIEVGRIEREAWADLETLGLSLSEGKRLTTAIQTEMVRGQASIMGGRFRWRGHCGSNLSSKGYRWHNAKT